VIVYEVDDRLHALPAGRDVAETLPRLMPELVGKAEVARHDERDVDLYSNRCERVMIAAGASRLAYEAEVVLSSPRDRIAPGTSETPIGSLPVEH